MTQDTLGTHLRAAAKLSATLSVACVFGLGAVMRSHAADRYVEVLVAADPSVYAAYGDDTAARVSELMDAVNAHFQDFSLTLATSDPILVLHVGTVLFTQEPPFPYVFEPDEEVDADALLSDFAAWRADPGNIGIAHDVAVLLTREDLSGGALKQSYSWSACNPATAAGVARERGLPEADAVVVSHALGHLLGMCHDPPATRDAPCASLPPELDTEACGGSIMSAQIDDGATQFSECSAVDYGDYLQNYAVACITGLNSLLPPNVLRDADVHACEGGTCMPACLHEDGLCSPCSTGEIDADCAPLNGHWTGKWKCTTFDGVKTTLSNVNSSLAILHVNQLFGDLQTLAVQIDGAPSGGYMIPSVKKSKKGELSYLKCSTDNSVGGADEVGRFKYSLKGAQGKISGTTIFTEGDRHGTCKYVYEIADRIAPDIPFPCP